MLSFPLNANRDLFSPRLRAMMSTRYVPTTLCTSRNYVRGCKKAPLYTERGWGKSAGYLPSLIRLVISSALCLKNKSKGMPLAAFSMSFISSSVKVAPTTRRCWGSLSVSFSKNAVISFHRVFGMLVHESQPYADASDTPSFAANSFRVIPSLASQIRSLFLRSSVSFMFISHVI